MDRLVRTSAKALVIRDGRMLAIRIQDWDGVFYILPGGGQRAGELLPDAAEREVAEETGIPKDVSNIVVPLGATMHMDGSAMSAIIKVAFLFGMFGQDFTTGRALLAIVVAVFSSVAMSGIPGGGGTGELVLCSIFFPDHLAVAFPIALALGNLVDPPATMVNSAGDYVVSFIVARFVDGKDWLQKQLQKQKAEQ